MRHLSLLLLFALLSSALSAQQTPQYSLYMLNPFEFNPAYAGLDDALSVTGALRRQWVGLEGAPSSQHANAHLPVYLTGGGFGISVANEETGPEQTTLLTAAYSFHLPLGKSALLSLGVGGGLYQKRLDGSILRTPGGVYNPDTSPDINHADPILSEGIQDGSSPVFNAGAFLKTDQLSIGISTIQSLEPDLAVGITSLQLVRTYTAMARYRLDLTRRISAEPSVMLRSDAQQTQIEFSGLFRFDENIFGGASFRGYTTTNRDALVLFGGFRLNEQTTLAYAYDLTVSSLQQVSSGSHEILINYRFGQPIGKGRPPKIIYNPRSL